MEDYKEKYEQALENIKAIKAANKDNKGLVDFIEFKYPELKESEDEKIRKELVRAFTVTANKRDFEIYGNGITYGQVLDWLEKQKDYEDELEKAYKCADEVQYRNGFKAGQNEVLENPQKYGLEKQGKQTSASITDEWIENYWQHKKVNNSNSYDKGEEIQFDHQGFIRFCKKYCKNPT